jgi:hypothetical protein
MAPSTLTPPSHRTTPRLATLDVIAQGTGGPGNIIHALHAQFVISLVLRKQVMEVQPQTVLDASVQCALEDSCLLFFDDTSMVDALSAFDDTGKTVGMVQVGHSYCICCE